MKVWLNTDSFHNQILGNPRHKLFLHGFFKLFNLANQHETGNKKLVQTEKQKRSLGSMNHTIQHPAPYKLQHNTLSTKLLYDTELLSWVGSLPIYFDKYTSDSQVQVHIPQNIKLTSLLFYLRHGLRSLKLTMQTNVRLKLTEIPLPLFDYVLPKTYFLR